ncbi:hypothetical protein C8R42DRAFT_582440 [Lentinula raphanica]|nr:hypothetical protein C8R42DRAFT_582440 [Lentinula raphanica]
MTSLENVMDCVATDFKLTNEQVIAFKIITTHVICRNVFHLTDWISRPPLVMLLTGPGGTGKTHVVRAVQKVMDSYGLIHGYRSLAPTANAASLISGTTLHSGCNIKI